MIAQKNQQKMKSPESLPQLFNKIDLLKLEDSIMMHRTCQEEILELKSKIASLEVVLKNKNDTIAALEEENKLLKAQNVSKPSKPLIISKASNHQKASSNAPIVRSTNSNANRNASVASNTMRAANNNRNGNSEESKTRNNPSKDELKSIQLARQLEAEERKMTMQFENARRRRGNQQRYYGDEINPDNMTYEELVQLGAMVGEVSKGLTKQQIKRIPSYLYRMNEQREEDATCFVCLCKFEDKEKMRRLKCFHEFHSKCIKPWLKEKKTCPVCKIEAI